jgi:hypothetical protein
LPQHHRLTVVQTRSTNTLNNLGLLTTGRTFVSLILSLKKDGNAWDGTNDNPIIEVTMKVKGDYKKGAYFGNVELLLLWHQTW